MTNISTILSETDQILQAFHVYNTDKKRGHFPHGKTVEAMYSEFTALCPGYDSYSDWIGRYKRLVNCAEMLNKSITAEMKSFRMNQREAQSKLALLANAVTKLIWLRRAGKSWRWVTIAKLKEEMAA